MKSIAWAWLAVALSFAGGTAGPEPKELITIKAHEDTVRCVAFSPNGKMVASGSWDSTAKVWDVSGVNTSGVHK